MFKINAPQWGYKSVLTSLIKNKTKKKNYIKLKILFYLRSHYFHLNF